MSIITAALVPHPPLLIPEIGKENWKLLEKTYNSYKSIEEDIYAGQVETVVIISAHGPEQEQAFGINIGEMFNVSFKEFGDFSDKISAKGDVALAQTLKEELSDEVNVDLVNKVELDHGVGVPLYLLVGYPPNKPEFLKKLKILPIYFSGADLNANYEFGQRLRRQLQITDKRIAVLASGDLSHCLTKNAPGGYSTKGAKFDKKIIEILKKGNFKEVMEIKENIIKEAKSCGLKPITILAGMLETIECRPELLSYEYPFGVGYLTMKFNF